MEEDEEQAEERGETRDEAGLGKVASGRPQDTEFLPKLGAFGSIGSCQPTL